MTNKYLCQFISSSKQEKGTSSYRPRTICRLLSPFLEALQWHHCSVIAFYRSYLQGRGVYGLHNTCFYPDNPSERARGPGCPHILKAYNLQTLGPSPPSAYPPLPHEQRSYVTFEVMNALRNLLTPFTSNTNPIHDTLVSA